MASSKEKKVRKRKKEQIEEDNQDQKSENNLESKESKMKKKKEKIHKKRKKEKDDHEKEQHDQDREDIDESTKVDKKKKRSKKKEEKEALLEKLPKTNELGLPFTKIQIRKMLKRVKKGLTPIPTEEEERELARLKAEEEKEIQSLMYKQDDDEDASSGDNIEKDEDEEGVTDAEMDETYEEQNLIEEDSVGSSDKKVTSENSQDNKVLKKPRSKPVPDDYICFACKNKHEPKHWIYDCPSKVTVKGTNKVKKKMRGVNDPDVKKVFVSGLPYDISRADIGRYFEVKGNVKVVGCKTLSFSDTGRFNGQAYLILSSEADAKNALELNGKTFEGLPKQNPDQDSQNKDKGKLRWLKVTKVLSRVVTKKLSKARKNDAA